MADEVRAAYNQLEQVARRFKAHGEATERMSHGLRGRMEKLRGQWIGRGSDAFFSEMQSQVIPAVQRLEQSLVAASQTTAQIIRLLQEAEQEAAALFKQHASDNRQLVRERWATLSDQERAEALRNISDEILRKHGLDTVTVKVTQLPDDNGDLRGQRSARGIEIDVDNVSDPSILNTIAHETRHEIQQRFADQATPSWWERIWNDEPDWPKHGVTKETAETWAKNFDNYISPETNYEKYHNQPVERDAREFGEDYLRNLTLADLERHIPD